MMYWGRKPSVHIAIKRAGKGLPIVLSERDYDLLKRVDLVFRRICWNLSEIYKIGSMGHGRDYLRYLRARESFMRGEMSEKEYRDWAMRLNVKLDE